MKEHPILFSVEMVRAMLTCAKCGKISQTFPCQHCGSEDFLKTQTRRVVMPRYFDGVVPHNYRMRMGVNIGICEEDKDTLPRDQQYVKCPYGGPGDRLWVRETWRPTHPAECRGASVQYRADEVFCRVQLSDIPPSFRVQLTDGPGHWRPSIHMPRWASRIDLVSKAVRAERLQDITEDDAWSEGCPRGLPTDNGGFFPAEKQIGPHSWVGYDDAREWFADLWDSINAKRGHGWDTNPWVWVIEFERVRS